jgi:hypothetical protein
VAIASNDTELEELLRRLARVLAPYIADELDRPLTVLDSGYNDETCRVFVSGLGAGVVERAIVLFERLARDKVGSVELAELVGVQGPRSIPGALNTALKRRAKELRLPLPFDGGEGALPYGGITHPTPDDDPGRTYWQDRDGIASRMIEALRNERASRQPPPRQDR